MKNLSFLVASLLLLVARVGWTQPPGSEKNDKEWARSPLKIPFQNDSHWNDSRWQQTDVGPFLTASIDTPKGATLKGIAIRVGDRQQAAVCFDTARLRISAGWTGDFLRLGARRFGLIDRPVVAGKLAFSTPRIAGWAKGERFQPEPAETTQLEVEQGYAAAGSTVVHLPRDWAAYQGLYTSGQRIVLSYSVGKTAVLESPWYVETKQDRAFVRSLEIGPAAEPLRMWIADPKTQVKVLGSPLVTLDKAPDGSPLLIVAPRDKTIRVKLLLTSQGTEAGGVEALSQLSGDVEDLARMIQQDTPRWPRELETVGTTTETGGPYVIDTLTIPFENPHKALFFTAGQDFFSNKKAAICTAHGDVWVVSGIDRNLKKLRWRRYATGLFQPLGLKIVADKVFVIGRDQITRLHDRNGDGEADFYENFNNDLFVSHRQHDYVTCLDTDPQGNFYFIHAKTGVMRVAADGSTMTTVGDGFRNPNGMAVGPQGTITASPQQGTWTPESSIFVVKKGGYYGFGGPRVTKDRPTGWDLPMCFVPRAMDNSGGAQVWVEGKRWGPLEGKMLHLSYGQCRLLLTLMENVDGQYQGGSIEFPTTPADFESGIMRGRFNPHDGQLYVTGLRGWQTRAVRDGCFQRLRYTGGPVYLPTGVKTYQNGIKVTFAEPLDPEMAENPGNFFVEQWNYLWSATYGSPDYSVANPKQQGRDEVSVVSATLLDDGHAVFLEMPNRHPVNQISISWLLRSTGGEAIRGRFAHTINSAPSEKFPGERIVRRPRPQPVDPAVAERLEPGLRGEFRSQANGETDVRISRMMAIYQDTSRNPTPFLPPGPFSIKTTGTLRIPLSGFYQFKVTGNGHLKAWINDVPILNQPKDSETEEPVLLHKGHNRLRVQYASAATGLTRTRLWWKGFKFDWEPVPADVFFHDPSHAGLTVSRQRRQGRQLVADHHCVRCHQTKSSPDGMLEMNLSPPDLQAAGNRFEPSWLQQWLLQPRKLNPGSHMPSLLGQGPQARQDAADLSVYLAAQQAIQKEPVSPPADEDSALVNGEQLFQSLGCINCHQFAAPNEKDPFGRRSLHFVKAKFQPGALARFLEKPALHHRAIGMPDFQLTSKEAVALAQFVRGNSRGSFQVNMPKGDAKRGQQLFKEKSCTQCHQVDAGARPVMPILAWKDRIDLAGCLAAPGRPRKDKVPDFHFSVEERQQLQTFLQNERDSLQRSSPVETSLRLVDRLRCASCHDRDGQRSPRALIFAEEANGKVAKVLPQLTRAGEKLQVSWTERLLAGKLPYKTRPWIAARMPAFPAYATAVAHGMAVEHAVAPNVESPPVVQPERVTVGQQLTLKTGLDCRQCHGIGDLQPRGDKNSKVSQGINFTYIQERLRADSYRRFMFDPPRYDINTNMIRLSVDGITTKVKKFYAGDAHQQFESLWHYIHSLPKPAAK